MKIIDYILICEFKARILQQGVQDYLAQGYELQGKLVVFGEQLLQAMVKRQ